MGSSVTLPIDEGTEFFVHRLQRDLTRVTEDGWYIQQRMHSLELDCPGPNCIRRARLDGDTATIFMVRQPNAQHDCGWVQLSDLWPVSCGAGGRRSNEAIAWRAKIMAQLQASPRII